MDHNKWKNYQSKLRQPLYSAPPGSPESDPAGVDEKDLVQIKRDRRQSQYLPPYRYDKDEQPSTRNIYRTSDEAYSTLARSLVYEYECCKHAYTAHQVILKNLTITQRKFFADAHMERAVNLPVIRTNKDKGKGKRKGEPQPPIHSLIRLVDVIYGTVFLEYFASKDGNLLQSQIENLNKATESEDFEMAGTQNDVRVAQSTRTRGISVGADRLMGKNVSGTPLARNTSAESRFEPKDNQGERQRQTKDDNSERQNNTNSSQHASDTYENHGESSFEKLYYEISTKEEGAIGKIYGTRKCFIIREYNSSSIPLQVEARAIA